MLTQLIQKINNRLPTQSTEKVDQWLYCVLISFHQGQTCFISAQLLDNDDLRGAVEIILQNPQFNSTELYVVTYLSSTITTVSYRHFHNYNYRIHNNYCTT